DDDVGAPDVLVDLKRDFRVGKPLQAAFSKRDAEKIGNLTRESGMRAPRKDLQLSAHHAPDRLPLHPGRPQPARANRRRRLVGAEGFEPSNTGSKDPRLTAWRRPRKSSQKEKCSTGQAPAGATSRA